MTKTQKDEMQRPEGKLLEKALGSAKRSRRDLASAIGLSEGRVRQIVNGYKTEAGMLLEIVAPADTLYRMAEELEISPEDMRAAGREDVADLLYRRPSLGVTEEGDLWLTDREAWKDELREWLDSDEERPPTEPLHLWSIRELLMAVDTKHEGEMTLLNHMLSVALDRRNGGTSDVDSDAAQKMNDDGDDEGEADSNVRPFNPTKPSQGPDSVDLSQEPSAAAPKRRDRGQGDDDA